jgi:UDPglucose--hexose-1-phosphate uridylyltransferase
VSFSQNLTDRFVCNRLQSAFILKRGGKRIMTQADAGGTHQAAFPHRRYNPLRGQWVLVSPHRTQRPWQGEVAKADSAPPVHYDPACYLCPGNTRAGGHQNPDYRHIFIFNNDYAALLPDSPAPPPTGSALLRAERERGQCRVLCFHPDHSLTLARMQPEDISLVVEAWREQYAELSAIAGLGYVQIFENRGAMMGASNPHPHCQIWATEHIPDEPAAEGLQLRLYASEHGSCLLCDYAALESSRGERVVCQNDEFLAVVPYWAVWPFEILIVSRAHVTSMAGFSAAQLNGLADILKQITTRYDNLFQTSFPYTMGFHQSPTDGSAHPEWHFHGHFYPPLLRSATVKKFMVGFEMLGMPQRDITAESAAARLREVSEQHYTLAGA